MNQEIKAKWVAALRSGKYTQGVGRLRDDGKHCCLGVLCEVSHIETGFGLDQNRVDAPCNMEILGNTIKSWAGLHKACGNSVTIDGVLDVLSSHNDAGKTFLQIADAIEAQL